MVSIVEFLKKREASLKSLQHSPPCPTFVNPTRRQWTWIIQANRCQELAWGRGVRVGGWGVEKASVTRFVALHDKTLPVVCLDTANHCYC